jgi:UDP-N-acetylmuramoyl-tripeptide--D-alanyl-D-alanine ligase
MGVDQQGQTTRLCEIARPTIGVITNIGPDHLEFFGSMEGSAQAKAELLDHLPQDGAVVLNADDEYFDYLAARAQCRVVAFGVSPKAAIRAVNIRVDEKGGTVFGLVVPGKSRQTEIRIRTQGQHNVSNALAAAAVGYALGLSGTAIAEGLAKFRPAAMRSQISMSHGVQVINDCYNANPASMKAAVQLLAELGRGKRSIAALGDMLELGTDSKRMHREVGAFLAAQGIGHLLACGVLGRELAEGARQAGMASDQHHRIARCGGGSRGPGTDGSARRRGAGQGLARDAYGASGGCPDGNAPGRAKGLLVGRHIQRNFRAR